MGPSMRPQPIPECERWAQQAPIKTQSRIDTPQHGSNPNAGTVMASAGSGGVFRCGETRINRAFLDW